MVDCILILHSPFLEHWISHLFILLGLTIPKLIYPSILPG